MKTDAHNAEIKKISSWTDLVVPLLLLKSSMPYPINVARSVIIKGTMFYFAH